MPTLKEMLLDLQGRTLLLEATGGGVRVQDFVEWEEGRIHAVARQWPTYGTDFVKVSSEQQSMLGGNTSDMLCYAAKNGLRLVNVQETRTGWLFWEKVRRKWYFVRPIRVTGMGPGVNGRITPPLEHEDW
jgi:hypothetical protein